MIITNYKLLITKKEKQGGFTLVETLVAILVLAIALNGIFTLVTSTIFSARYAKNEITGMYLAQEAIDYVRNDRDTIVAHGGGTWDSFLSKYGYIPTGNGVSCFSPNGCQFDVTKWELASIENYNVNRLIYYEDNSASPVEKYYSYDGPTATSKTASFSRKITMKLNNVGQSTSMKEDELVVTVEVDWQNGNLPHSQTLTTSLLNW